MAFRLTDMLRRLAGPNKEKSIFASDKEAYDFCRQAYNDSGGVTPELRRAYEFYQNALNDECPAEIRPTNRRVEAYQVEG